MKLLKKIITILICVVVLLLAIFLIGRYGWKLCGFTTCETAGIEQVVVEENQVQIRGFYPGSAPQGFLGYHAKQIDDTLYVGFKFSGFFGFFETGDFNIVVPTNGTVSQVVVKSNKNEHSIWPEKEDTSSNNTDLNLDVDKENLSSNETNLSSQKAEKSVVPTAYESIIAQYRTALKDNWDGQKLSDAELNLMIGDIDPKTVGYTVKDLDGNGIPELVIGTISGDNFYGKLILVLYTMNKDGDAIQVFSSADRNRYYYADNNRFANLGSSSAFDSFVTTLKLEGEELIDMTFTTKPKNYVQINLTPILS